MKTTISTCHKIYQTSIDQQAHCRIGEKCSGWGCKHLVAIATEPTCFAFNYWYSQGEFSKDGNCWLVDKKALLSDLQKEIEIVRVSACPVFSMEKLLSKIAEYPDKLDLSDTEHWLILKDESGKKTGVIHAEVESPFEDLGSDWSSDIKWE